MKVSSKTTETGSEPSAPTPDVVQDYISSMLRELSEMASMSGLKNLSSLLQVTLLASNTDFKSPD